MEERSLRRNLGGGSIEQESSRRNRGGGVEEEEPSRGNHGGGTIEEKSWRRYHRGGAVEEESRRWDHEGGSIEEESWRKTPRGGVVEEGSWIGGSGRRPRASEGRLSGVWGRLPNLAPVDKKEVADHATASGYIDRGLLATPPGPLQPRAVWGKRTKTTSYA